MSGIKLSKFSTIGRVNGIPNEKQVVEDVTKSLREEYGDSLVCAESSHLKAVRDKYFAPQGKKADGALSLLQAMISALEKVTAPNQATAEGPTAAESQATAVIATLANVAMQNVRGIDYVHPVDQHTVTIPVNAGASQIWNWSSRGSSPELMVAHERTSNTLLVYDLHSPTVVSTALDQCQGAVLGEKERVFCRHGYNLVAWDRATEVKKELDDSSNGFPLCTSPDGTFLAASCDGKLKIWKTDTLEKVGSFDLVTTGAAFSPDNKTLATHDQYGNVTLIDLTTKKVTPWEKTSTVGRGNWLIFSKDSRYFFYLRERVLQRMDLTTGAIIEGPSLPDEAVLGAHCLSPDGQSLLFGLGRQLAVIRLNTLSMTCNSLLEKDKPYSVDGVWASADGKTVYATGGAEVTVLKYG